MKHTAKIAALAAAFALPFGAPAMAQDTVELHGASQFGDDHAFTKALVKFQDAVGECSDGKVTFVLHKNSELGLEKDYFNFMSQGVSVDYAIVSPSHMSTYSKKAPLMDMPFLFRDLDHWNKVLDQGGLDPIAQDVSDRADVELIGYAGGGTRNLIVNKPVTNMAELADLPMRVMGAPIQTRIFEAVNAAPSVIAYDEVYNAIQTGVIDAAENEAAGIEQMKFYEVGPDISLTQHAITVRPIAFSGKTMKRLPEDLQACIRQAGMEAGKYGRDLESSQDSEKLAAMESAGYLKTHVFTERDKLLELAEPVKRAYAEELGATDTLDRINAIQ
ncbi:TRAP transporter substrate-binding protein [Acuticoccus sp. MNP-M23]|uniref:TRAP transporter substrate-binding protein n=1 Tax=Acuticoccus sp. MNP-M23 TaxID=3072793 RepID=UPI002814B4B4|nr:TRAP transporter substrate-binding protein [Acuticoccus sp. MNP-M23]WMS44714.1 TRAP transporter substrate-binding protein [Acuticoccus sp. MNP-M23]